MPRRRRSPFALRMAIRDLGAGSRHFVAVLAAIGLGVGAVVAVGTTADAVRRTVAREARSLLAADVEIKASRALSDRAASVVDALPTRGVALTRVTELIAMAASPQASLLVELKAVEDGYPFYGRLETEPVDALSGLPTGPTYGAVVQDAFLIRTGLRPGDRFTIGRAEFVAAAVLRGEPDRAAGAFSLGPRVLIARSALDATGLIQPGSRVRYRVLLRVPEGMGAEALRDELRTALADEPVEITAYPDAQPQLRRSLDRLATYLGLVGLTALLIGGVGVAGSIRAHLAEHWQTIALLKCLGARSAVILRVYLLETIALGLGGSFLGVLVGTGSHLVLRGVAASVVGLDLGGVPSPWPVVRGLAIGVTAALLFALWPLLQVARQSPASIFRREVAPSRTTSRASWTVAVVLGLGLSALAWWQAGAWRMAALFAGAVVAAVTLLGGAAWAVARVARAVPRPRRLAWRRGVASLYRPGARTTAIVVSLGVGVMVVLGVTLVEHAVRAELVGQLPVDAPSVFFIDIQPDQRDAFASLLASRSVTVELTPIVRSRLASLNGASIGSEGPPGTKPEDRWYFTREYVLTFRDDLPRDNTVVAGTWWDQAPHETSVSVEQEAARHLGVAVGSTMVFDVQGVLVTARVANLRSVNWNNRSTNFFVIFAPGVIEAAPVTYVGAARTPAVDEIPLQQAVVAAFPNVTAIQVRDVLASAARVIDRITLAIRAVAAFTVLAGFVVLAGALAATREARLREAMMFKALGATRRTIARAFAIEFAVLGVVAGVVGTALATALAWAVLRFIIEIPWRWDAVPLLAAVALTAAATVAVGVASTHRLIGRRPFPVLRGE
ncbi:MAG: FtsX-like permease family protein [Nitrospirae bacterium]|nr:FtsX-like permease family protein [Nitrospirota bacterium]